jgi:hypothetical protein
MTLHYRALSWGAYKTKNRAKQGIKCSAFEDHGRWKKYSSSTKGNVECMVSKGKLLRQHSFFILQAYPTFED